MLPSNENPDLTYAPYVMYSAGFYPCFDLRKKRLNWRRESTRAVISLKNNKLDRNIKSIKKEIIDEYIIRKNCSPYEVISNSADKKNKKNSWVTREIVEIYHNLLANNQLTTYEAYLNKQLVGGLISINIGKIAIADTMYGIPQKRSASKACLLSLASELISGHYEYIDVQVKHKPDHPSSKLGEIILPIEEYLKILKSNAREAV